MAIPASSDLLPSGRVTLIGLAAHRTRPTRLPDRPVISSIVFGRPSFVCLVPSSLFASPSPPLLLHLLPPLCIASFGCLPPLVSLRAHQGARSPHTRTPHKSHTQHTNPYTHHSMLHSIRITHITQQCRHRRVVRHHPTPILFNGRISTRPD